MSYAGFLIQKSVDRIRVLFQNMIGRSAADLSNSTFLKEGRKYKHCRFILMIIIMEPRYLIQSLLASGPDVRLVTDN